MSVHVSRLVRTAVQADKPLDLQCALWESQSVT